MEQTLEIIGTLVGLLYLWLEYRASIYLWMKVCQNAHLLFFTHKAPTFTSWGFVIT